MDNVSLCIPFMVLSTKINQSGEVEKHILTPFGGVDINFRLRFHSSPVRKHYEIQVGGEIERWMHDAALIDKFRSCLLEFVRGISRECLGYAGLEAEDVYVRFQGRVLNLRIPWMSSNQDQIDQPLKIDGEPEKLC